MSRITSDRDYQALEDLETLARAKDLEGSPGRLAAARRFAESESERFAGIADNIPKAGRNLINGARRGPIDQPFGGKTGKGGTPGRTRKKA